MVAAGELASVPVISPEQSDIHSAILATSAAPLYALKSLDAETLTAQEMTDQELKAVEGGEVIYVDGRLIGQGGAWVYYDLTDYFLMGFYGTCKCR
jgi:bacteriocin-like protein